MFFFIFYPRMDHHKTKSPLLSLILAMVRVLVHTRKKNLKKNSLLYSPKASVITLYRLLKFTLAPYNCYESITRVLYRSAKIGQKKNAFFRSNTLKSAILTIFESPKHINTSRSGQVLQMVSEGARHTSATVKEHI